MDSSHDSTDRLGRARTIYLETFGCQMNELDSELVRGHLMALGYEFTPDAAAADVVLYNTCSVREQAENKVLSRLGILGVEKSENERNVVVGVLGCMAEREGADMIRKYPQIDLMCGPGELDKLPMLLDNALKVEAVDIAQRVSLQGSTSRRSATLSAVDDDLELLDLSRAFDPDRANAGGRTAYVRITRGCNKFCTYCVVPHTRGAEVHRPPDSIIDECKRLADKGVIEITLLGQTVNHYMYVHGVSLTTNGREAPQIGPGAGTHARESTSPVAGARTTTFADLLHRIHEEVPSVQRLRFVTSYPRDFSDDALRVMAESPRICRYLHVPAQSGSNRILGLMNRGYTVEQYLEFIDRAVSFMPDVSIAGDFIVGFPGETDEDFEATKELVRRVPFKNNFIFKYSPRPGTVAIKRFDDDIHNDVKRQRNNELLAVQAEVSAAVHSAWVGRTVDVFVEKVSRASNASRGNVELRWQSPKVQVSGRTGGDLITVLDIPEGDDGSSWIGRMVRVEVTSAGPLLLYGRAVGDAAGNHGRGTSGASTGGDAGSAHENRETLETRS
ncbi:MAG: MiaB/RimO family radical SAM methylthiotransferase [Phycisphaerales bacterium]|nr:MiaB/RimO family radical SAM methylthiotransferase [Phycisphaerales bacterium]